jgi:hypothetical protein
MPDVVIVDAAGTEHVFPEGFDPKKAGAIVRYRTQDHPPSAEDFTETPEGTGVMGAVSSFAHAMDPRPLVSTVADMYRASQGDPTAASRTLSVGKNLIGAQGQQLSKAVGSARQGRISEAIGHGAAGLLPLVGPAAANAGERIGSGDIAGGLGEAAAVLAPFAAPTALGAVARGGKSAAGNLYMRALKPTKAVLQDAPAFRIGGQAAARSELAQTGLSERVPVGGAGGVEKVGTRIEDINQQIADRIGEADLAGRTVDPSKVKGRLIATKQKFSNQVAPQSDLQAIERVGEDFSRHPQFGPVNPFNPAQPPGPMSLTNAQAMKQGTYRTLKGKAYGEMKSADIEGQKALARGLKEEISAAAPEVGPLNARESQLISLQKALQDRARTGGNADPFKLGEQVLMAGTNPKSAILGLLNRPSILSRGAIGVNDISGALAKVPAPFKAALLSILGAGQQEQP